MMQLVVFVLALVAVFSVNAIIAMRTRDSIVSNSEAFSWMSVKPEDAEAAALAAETSEPVRVASGLTARRAVSAGI